MKTMKTTSHSKKNAALQKATHDYGMRKIRKIPGVISALHVERKKYIIGDGGVLTSVPEYVITVKYRKMNSSIIVREIKLNTHPDNIGVAEYNYIVNNLFKDGK